MTPIEVQIARRVLLVDDDGAVRSMMEQGLQRKGFEVVTAESVTEALQHIAGETFDVLITDLHMPNPGDGFTVSARCTIPTGRTDTAGQWLPGRAERYGRHPSRSGRNHREAIRNWPAYRTRRRTTAQSQTC